MKVVMLSCHADGTGYAKAAIEYILALDSVGVTVVPRSVKMTNTSGEVPQRIRELEQNDLHNVDVVVQYNLPNTFSYKSGVLNVGIFDYETNQFFNSGWQNNLKLMDKIVVPCEFQKNSTIRTCGDSVASKTHIVPHALNLNRLYKNYTPITFGLPKNTLKFYTISEFGKRKNIPALLMSYYSAFSANDNVILIIKTHLSNRNAESTIDAMKKLCDDIKTGLRRFANNTMYPKVLVLGSYMSDEQICQLHKSCDVFVSASHGEAFCIPAMEAMACGNILMVPDHTAFHQYVSPQDNILIPSEQTNVFGVTDAPQGLYSADELWYNVNIAKMTENMRDLLVYKPTIDEKFKNSRAEVVKDKFSYATVGNKLKEIFTDAK